MLCASPTQLRSLAFESSLPDELNHDGHDVHSWAINIKARMRTVSQGMPGVREKKEENIRISKLKIECHPTERIIEYSGPALKTAMETVHLSAFTDHLSWVKVTCSFFDVLLPQRNTSYLAAFKYKGLSLPLMLE